jgi:protein TonB
MSTIRQQDFDPGQHGGRRVGVGVVVGVHVLVGWGLASGLGNQLVAAVKKPLEAVVLQEVVLPPPPPPPPPPKPVQPPKQVVQQAAPPPPFVPPAEVQAPPATEAPVVQASLTPPPVPAPIAPPPPAPAPQQKMDLTIACPTQAKPEVPQKALRDGVSGTVRAQAIITGGVVSAVEILSGPRIFHAAVRDAMQKYRCTAPDGTVAMQAFEFRVE